MREDTSIALGVLAAGGVPIIIGGPLSFMRSGVENTNLVETLVLALAFYPFFVMFVCIFGLPLFFLFRRYNLVRWWSAIISGLLGGGVVALAMAAPIGVRFDDFVTFAVEGVTSALLFLAVWKQRARA